MPAEAVLCGACWSELPELGLEADNPELEADNPKSSRGPGDGHRPARKVQLL